MSNIYNIEWFKLTLEPSLNNYEVKYSSFEDGDFGALNRVEINSDKIGATIDFWEFGNLGIHLVDYFGEKELLNVFLDSNENEEKKKLFEELRKSLVHK